MVRVGVCIALSPRLMLEGGSVTCGLISVLQRDLFAEDTGLQPPPYLACWSLHCKDLHPTKPPSPPLQESYPAVPPIWSVESDDPNLAAILERLVEVRKGNTLVRYSLLPGRGEGWQL